MLPRTYSTHQSCFMASSSQNSQSWGSHPINHALSRRQVPSCARLEPYHIPTGPLHSLPAPSAYAHPPRSLVYPQARCTASQPHLHTHTHRAVSSTHRPAAQPPSPICIRTPTAQSRLPKGPLHSLPHTFRSHLFANHHVGLLLQTLVIMGRALAPPPNSKTSSPSDSFSSTPASPPTSRHGAYE